MARNYRIYRTVALFCVLFVSTGLYFTSSYNFIEFAVKHSENITDYSNKENISDDINNENNSIF